jgi:hypothetical protein
MFEKVLIPILTASFMYSRHILRRRKIVKSANRARFGGKEALRQAMSREL